MDDRIKEFLNNYRPKLVENIDIEHGLLDRLVSSKVLTSSHVDDIQSKQTKYTKIGTLLDILKVRDTDVYDRFRDDLAVDQRGFVDAHLPTFATITGASSKAIQPPTEINDNRSLKSGDTTSLVSQEFKETGKSVSDLNHILQLSGVLKATYDEAVEDKLQKKFLVSVKCPVVGTLHKKLTEGKTKKDLQQEAAKEVLQRLNVLDISQSTSPMDALHGLIGKRGLKEAEEYVWMVSKLSKEEYLLVVTKALTDLQEVEFEGEWCGGKQDAKHSAAKAVLDYLKKYDLLGSLKAAKDCAGATGNSNSSVVTATGTALSGTSSCSDTRDGKSVQAVKEVPKKKKRAFDVLSEEAVKMEVDVPEKKSSTNSKSEHQATLLVTHKFQPSGSFPTKKEAEKQEAQRVLQLLYPGSECSEAGKPVRNVLQEKRPNDHSIKLDKKLPYFDTVPNGKEFACSITVRFEVQGEKWHPDEEAAIQEVAEAALNKLGMK